MTKVEMIRMVKAMQTEMIQQRAALSNAASGEDDFPALDLRDQLYDTQKTAADHIGALQHVIDLLQPKPTDG